MKTEIKELLPITQSIKQGLPEQLVNARDLWRFLDSKQHFADWFKNNVKEYGFKKGIDYFLLHKSMKQSDKNSILLNPKPTRGGHNRKDYLITLPVAKELAMVERNQMGRLARHYFIKCEEALKAIAPDTLAQYRQEWQAQREASKTPFKRVCEALERYYSQQGKTTAKHHYTNEANMLTSLAIGMNVHQWRKAHAVETSTREALNSKQLAKLTYLEQADEMLLDMGLNFQNRKGQLTEMLAKRFTP